MVDKKFNLGWGEPEIIRETTNSVYGLNSKPWIHTLHDSFYPPHTGFDSLKESISNYMLERTDILYPVSNIFITNGATGAINAAILAYKKIHGVLEPTVITNNMYFGFYPNIIKNAGARHEPYLSSTESVFDIALKDSPSNPEGKIAIPYPAHMLIWDAAYFSPAYIPLNNIKAFIPIHDIMIGSASKLIGLSGERVGWLAVKPFSKYEQYLNIFADIVTHLFCGVSFHGQKIVNFCFPLKNNSGDKFFKKSKAALDQNKEEWSKLKHIFDGALPNEIGMFFLSKIDPLAKKLLDDCGILYKYGQELGVGGDGYIRINMAASKLTLKEAVKTVLKKDQIV
jgi:aspartate/methionine/tyrosine aminotransferase